MLDGNRLLLSGSFGDDVTDVNESPLRSSRDEIRPSAVEISCLAPPEPPVYPAPSCLRRLRTAGPVLPGSAGPASARRFNSHFMALLVASAGIPGEPSGSRAVPSLSGSGLSFILFMLPLRSAGDIFVSLHHIISSQVISSAQVSTLPLPSAFRCLWNWLGSGRWVFL